MKSILVYYTFQKNQVESIFNVFAIPNTFNSLSDICVKDIINGFPLLKLKTNYHLRFKTQCSEIEPKIHGWLDISNFNAKVPLINNAVYMKVLEIPLNGSKIYNETTLSRIFRKDDPTKKQLNSKSHIKSHSPQPQQFGSVGRNSEKSYPTSAHTHAHTHSFDNLPENKANTENKQSLFGDKFKQTKEEEEKINKNFIKKTSINLFENDQKSDADPNLLVFSPVINANHSDLKGEKFVLDEGHIGNMTREELVEAKKEFVRQKVENKFAEVKEIWDKEEEVKKMRFEAASELETAVINWAKKNNTRNNLRTLIATMGDVLGKESEWNPINLSELLSNEQVKKAYVRAIRVVHPDKNQDKDHRQRYIAERVFYELNEAWKDYRSQHGIL